MLTTAIAHAGEGVIITDAHGIIRYCNPAAEALTGYSAQEMLGQDARILKFLEHSKEFYDGLWSTITSGRVWNGQFANRKKDGSLFHEEATISPIYERGGKLNGFVAVKRDVTERLNLERQLRQAQKLESVGRLAAGVAHDYNNLLTVINGYAEMLRQLLDDGTPARNFADEISKAGEHAVAVTRQLMVFSRKQVGEPMPLDLNRLIARTIGMLERILGYDIEIVTRFDAELPGVMADPDQLRQVLVNLVVNARDAMPRGGTITICTRNVSADERAGPDTRPQAGIFAVAQRSGHRDGNRCGDKGSYFRSFFHLESRGARHGTWPFDSARYRSPVGRVDFPFRAGGFPGCGAECAKGAGALG